MSDLKQYFALSVGIIVSSVITQNYWAIDQEASWQEVQHILKNRCITCHSCYSAPCQLNLNSYEGFLRGSSKDRVYNGNRITTADLTRVFIDANTESQWHNKLGFSPIYSSKGNQIFDRVTDSAKRRLHLKKRKLDVEESRVCPDNSEWQDFRKAKNYEPMPFGFPPLNVKEISAISTWKKNGSKGQITSDSLLINQLPESLHEKIKTMEDFLNQKSNKHKIVSRYLYEHFFLAQFDKNKRRKKF